MPQYYFDIRDSSGLYPDDEGLELPDTRAAELEAVRSLANIIRDAAPQMQFERMAIEVRIGEGRLFQVAVKFDVSRGRH
jgi:hypothetical protein